MKIGGKIVVTILSILFFTTIIVVIAAPWKDRPAPEPPTRAERIESGFNGLNGSHFALTRLIKEHMNDPKSYEHVKTVYWDKGDYLVVQTTFRGKNAFGGMIIDNITAKCSIDGEVLEIIN